MARRSADKETGLTPQQEAFCVALVKHGNATQAYREAYPAQKMKPDSLAVKACRLANTDKIRLRVESLRSNARKRSGITLDDHMRDLKALRNAAAAVKQFGPAITAEMARGKVSGLYTPDDESGDVPAPVKVEISVVDGRRQV